MTDRVYPSLDANASSRTTARTIQFAGGSDGWVVPAADDPGNLATDDPDIDETALNAFAATTSATSHDVTIDPGAALVGGAWLARDVSTTVTLAASTADQTVYAGWDVSKSHQVIVGLASAFNADDPTVPLFEFDTDSTTVTATNDIRKLRQSFGIDYLQTTEPIYYEGKTWLDPDSGVFYAGYDSGGGGDYHPIPPVRVLNEASTFAESTVTLTHNGTKVSNESIALSPGELHLINQFDVSSEASGPNGMAWNNDGTKMYIADTSNDSVYEYNLSTAYDTSTASYSQSFDISTEGNNPQGITFDGTGAQMFIIGSSSDSVHEYELSTTYDISTATFNRSLDVSGQDTAPTGMAWNGDGTKMYVVGVSNDNVYEYTASTAYDIGTVSYSQAFSVGTEDGSPKDITWNGDGTKMYITGGNNDTIYQYALSTAYDVSTASLSQSASVNGWDPEEATWNGDGTKMYVVGDGSDDIYEYRADVAYDVNPPAFTSGDALIEWPTESDIESWDLATFQRTLDTETVTVDVEDSAGNVLFSDISQNFDISTVDTTKNVALRANLSRADTANNPTLDYAARRYVR